MTPRLAETKPSAVKGNDGDSKAVSGTPFPPLENSPDVTPTGKIEQYTVNPDFESQMIIAWTTLT